MVVSSLSDLGVGKEVTHTHTTSSVVQSQQGALLVSALQHLSQVSDFKFIAKFCSHPKQLLGESEHVAHGDLQEEQILSESVKKPLGHRAKQD